MGTHRAFINGAVKTINGGKCLINGAVKTITGGKTMVNGAVKNIDFVNYINSIPTMTSNTAPSGTVTGFYSSGAENDYLVFDGDLTTSRSWSGGAAGAYITYNCASGTVLKFNRLYVKYTGAGSVSIQISNVATPSEDDWTTIKSFSQAQTGDEIVLEQTYECTHIRFIQNNVGGKFIHHLQTALA